MQITTLFVCCWCVFLIKKGRATLTDNIDANIEADLLKELKQIQNEFREKDGIKSNRMLKMAEQLENQREMIEMLKHRNARSSSESKISAKENETPSEPTNRFTSIACAGDKFTLQCPGERKISVTDGYFGKYKFSCDEGCCAPSPYQDCTEAVSQAEPADWFLLKDNCDTKTECENQYSGKPINGCDLDSYVIIADYMHIYYDCVPEVASEPVGFTAHATKDRDYAGNETVVFDDVQSNFGGYYNGKTSTFICPHSGIYFFSVNFNAGKNVNMDIEIVRDNVVLSGAMAYMETSLEINSYSHADAFAIVQCNAGQFVWARADNDGKLHAPEKYSQFSGYLLQRDA